MSSLRESLIYEPRELQFGTSGLRALVTDMTDLECYINTRGFLRFLEGSHGLQPGDVVYVAGDLRDSTPRIMRAVVQAARDSGYKPDYCGLIPTPTVSLYGFAQGKPSIMVTGSHIPADRNGIKFIKPHDEVLKDDESGVKTAVASVRAEIYALDAASAQFDGSGMLRTSVDMPVEHDEARKLYFKRYTEAFDVNTLAGKKVVFYQHSAVGRDMLPEIFEALGATVVPVGRSDVFIPIDSENVKVEDEAYFRKLAQEHPDAFAIVSTDGDSDRPFVIDEHGEFHRGDMLGVVVANWLKADFCAYPVSASDAADKQLSGEGIAWEHTRIGSPYVVASMKTALSSGKRQVVGWEVNGGFLIGSELTVNGHKLQPLPTRDAFIAILVALVSAIESGNSISAMFAGLPQRFTQAGLINNFPVAVAQEMKRRFGSDDSVTRTELGKYFSATHGFGAVTSINALDGIRMYFDNGDIAHFRPSGNAPQLRIYSVADSQDRADEIVAMTLAEPDGIFRQIQQSISQSEGATRSS